MEKNDILSLILGLRESVKYKSTLQIALKQARRLIGYNKEIGGASHGNLLFRTYDVDLKSLGLEDIQEVGFYQQQCNYEEHDVLTSVILYLIVLDQLGHVFGKIKSNSSNSVTDAINNTSYRTILSQKQKDAVRQLRNSLCHNMGLASYNPEGKTITHQFTMLFDDKNENNIRNGISVKVESEVKNVKVNLFALCNMVEDVLQEHIKKYQNTDFTSSLDVEILKNRFIVSSTR